MSNSIEFRDFAAHQNPDDSLTFGLRLMLPDTHSCAISGKAYPNSRGWRFETGMNDSNADKHCALDIQKVKEGILITQDPHTTCQYYCGNTSSFKQRLFPYDTRAHDVAKPFDPDTLTCKPDPSWIKYPTPPQ